MALKFDKQKIPILRISDDKDLIADTKLLNQYIQEHDKRVSSRYNKFWNAYACNSDIMDTSIVPAKAQFKPDNRISANYPRYIVDTYNGFARGIPVTVTSEDDAVSEYVNEIWERNNMDDVNAEIHKNKCIFGEAYQIIYVDEDGEIGTVPSDPLESFPVYNNSIRPKVRYFVRTYYDEYGKRHGTISDDTYVYYFDFDGSDIKFGETQPHGFNDVPVVVYIMNNARIGLIEIVLPMCNAFDKALSEKANDVDAFADAIMKVLGIKLDEEQIETLRDKRIVNVGGKDGKDVVVEFMGRPSGDTTQEHLLERLERLIFTVSMVCNVSDNNFATSSGIALKMKMEPMSNLASGDWRNDQASMKQFYKLVFSNPVNSVSEDAWTSLEFSHSLNYPDDVSDAADVAVKLDGVVSKKTQLSILPGSIVPDVDAELEQIAVEEKEDNSQLVKDIKSQENALNAPDDSTKSEIVIGEKEDE